MPDAATTLASAPIGSILRDMAFAIADAQGALDQAGIDAAQKLADPNLTGLTDPSGDPVSLLALGFAPTFYNFIEADLELYLETRIQEETTVGLSVGGSVDAQVGTVAVGMTMSADFQRKFAVETSGHTRITAKLVALPAPTRFLEFLSGEA